MRDSSPKKEQWLRHLDRGKQYEGGIVAYCREHDLSTSSYYYWRRKLGQPQNKALEVIKSSFIPVAVNEVPKDLPDPEWVARFVGELLRGFR